MSVEFGPDSPNWFSRVEAPEQVADPESVQWDDSADFVVVGYGGAGVSAALQAAENGLRVISMDAFGGGGATAMNGGIFLCRWWYFSTAAGRCK